MKSLPFSYNWNNKLNCQSFSTIRICNPSKYVLLDVYEIILKSGKNQPPAKKGIARLQSISNFYLDKVSPAMSFIDTNLSVIDFIQMVKKMYKNFNINWKTKQMSFLVFQYLTEEEIKEL